MAPATVTLYQKEECHLKLYQVAAVTSGTDAQAEVMIRLEKHGKLVNGHGADVDTLVAKLKEKGIV